MIRDAHACANCARQPWRVRMDDGRLFCQDCADRHADRARSSRDGLARLDAWAGFQRARERYARERRER